MTESPGNVSVRDIRHSELWEHSSLAHRSMPPMNQAAYCPGVKKNTANISQRGGDIQTEACHHVFAVQIRHRVQTAALLPPPPHQKVMP